MATMKTPTIKRIYKMTEFDLLRTKVEMGNMYMCVDTQKLYFDGGSTADDRTIYDYISVRTVNDLLYNITPSFGKSYYCWEDNSLWIWVNKWETLYSSTTYPSAYVYDDIPGIGKAQSINSIYRYDMPNMPADDNGLLKDGSVIVRDRNRIIKGKIYINDGNDNLVISSYLGGGIRFLPNGKQSTEGELYICDDTYSDDDSVKTKNVSIINFLPDDSTVQLSEQEIIKVQTEFNLNNCTAPTTLSISNITYQLDGTPNETSSSYTVKYVNSILTSKYFTVVNNVHSILVNGKPNYSYVKSEFHTIGNDLYIDYSENPDADFNLYPKSSHIYKVYHEGNLDVSTIKIMTPLQIYNKLMEKDELPDPFEFNVKIFDGHTPEDFAMNKHTHTSADITDITNYVSSQAGVAVKSIFNNMDSVGITGSYDTVNNILKLQANSFNISLSGGVEGNARVSNLTDTVIDVTVDGTKHKHNNYENTLTSLQTQINNLTDSGIENQFIELFNNRSYITTIGDNINITFTINHNLDAQHIIVQFRDLQNNQQINLDNIQIDNNTLQVNTTQVLSDDSVEVIILKIN